MIEIKKALLLLVTLTYVTQAEMKKTYEATYECNTHNYVIYSPYYRLGRLCVDNVVYNTIYQFEAPHDLFKSYNYKTKEPYYCTETTKVNKGFMKDTCTYTMTTFENAKDIK